MNTLDSLVFIWSIHQIKIEVESDENIFSMPDFLQKRISNLVLNFQSPMLLGTSHELQSLPAQGTCFCERNVNQLHVSGSR